MKGFINAKVYVENQGIITACVGVENGKIAYIGDDASVITKPYEYSEGQVVLPGFIDEHIHGAMGADAMDGTTDALKTIAGALASEGTTGFLATTMTQSPENINRALSAVKEYIALDEKDGAKVLGVHLEGPFISVKHIGAQPLEYVAKPNVEIFDKYNAVSGNNIKLVSLAPETEGAEDLIRHLAKIGVVASLGHSDACYVDIEKALSYGLSCITHTYNVQKPLHHREVGAVGSAMLFDELNAEMIADTIHVSVPAMMLLVKNKPADKLTLITDAMRAKGIPDGESELGGQKVFVKNGEARLADGTLAGSVLRMNRAIQNVVEKVGVPFLQAVDYATINPATTLGVADEMGSIKVGKRADFTVINKNYDVLYTVRDGEIVYKA